MKPIHSVLIVSTGPKNDVLHAREFIWPIQRCLPVPSHIIHVSQGNLKKAQTADTIIFSGCNLQENNYLKHAKKWSWLKKTRIPVLGVCAGHQLLVRVFGGRAFPLKKPAIGVEKLTLTPDSKKYRHSLMADFSAKTNVYFLHQNDVTLPASFFRIGKSFFSENDLLVHRSLPMVGVSFHPEVLNKSFFSHFIEWAEMGVF